MGTSNTLVAAGDPNDFNPRDVKALVKKQRSKRGIQLANKASVLDVEARWHRHKVETVLFVTEEDVISVARFANTVRETVDGDPMVANLVAPMLQDAVATVRADLRQTFRASRRSVREQGSALLPDGSPEGEAMFNLKSAPSNSTTEAEASSREPFRKRLSSALQVLVHGERLPHGATASPRPAHRGGHQPPRRLHRPDL